jgi:hypothetical protein
MLDTIFRGSSITYYILTCLYLGNSLYVLKRLRFYKILFSKISDKFWNDSRSNAFTIIKHSLPNNMLFCQIILEKNSYGDDIKSITYFKDLRKKITKTYNNNILISIDAQPFHRRRDSYCNIDKRYVGDIFVITITNKYLTDSIMLSYIPIKKHVLRLDKIKDIIKGNVYHNSCGGKETCFRCKHNVCDLDTKTVDIYGNVCYLQERSIIDRFIDRSIDTFYNIEDINESTCVHYMVDDKRYFQ